MLHRLPCPVSDASYMCAAALVTVRLVSVCIQPRLKVWLFQTQGVCMHVQMQQPSEHASYVYASVPTFVVGALSRLSPARGWAIIMRE